MNDQKDPTSNTGGTPNTSVSGEQVCIADVLAKMSVCVRSLTQYGRSHPLIADLVGSAHSAMSELLAAQPSFIVVAAESYLATGSFPVEDKTGCLESFAKLLRARRVCELQVQAGITETELLEMVEVLCITPEALELTGGVEAELKKRGVTHIRTRSGIVPVESREARDPAEIYEEAILMVEEALKAVQSGLQIPVPEIRAVVADSLGSLVHDDSALLALAGIRSYDRELLARFASRANLYPIGSIVTLKNGDYAVVVGGSRQQPRRPRLRIVAGPTASETGDTVVDLALCDDPGLQIDTVAQPIEALLPYTEELVAA